MGHQLTFIKNNWKTKYSHGGDLRRLKAGRGQRPLSTRDPLHLVFKADRSVLHGKSFRGYRSLQIIHRILKRYSWRFFVRIEQVSIQGDHIHLLVRCPRRAQFHHFFRVVAGQIAQIFEKEGLLHRVTDTPHKLRGPLDDEVGHRKKSLKRRKRKLWPQRPFTRVVKSFRAYQIVRDYIQLNELEAQGKIPYRKTRLKGLSAGEWEILW